MGIVLDGVIVLVMAILVITAYKAGFVKAVMGLVKSVAAFIASYAFAPTLGEWISEKFLIDRLSDGIAETIRSLSETAEGKYNLSGMTENMDSALRSIVNNYGVEQGKLVEVCRDIIEGTDAHVDKVADFIAGPIADRIAYSIAFGVIFLAVFIILSILTSVVDGIFRLPVLNSINKTFGLLLGIAQATVFLFVCCTVGVTLIVALGSVDSAMFGMSAVENSFILSTFSKIFPKLDLFGLL